MKPADIDRIADHLYAAVNRKIAQKQEQVAERVQEAVGKLQQTFFKVMASEIHGVSEAPNLGEFTPSWKPLNPAYVARKQKKHIQGFYTFTGKLNASLLMEDANVVFGVPLATITQGSRSAKTYDTGTGVRTVSGKFGKLSNNPSTVIKVSPYPDVEENIMEPQSTEFEERYLYFNSVQYKLTNYKGGRDRPILIPFMRWWLNVKVKQAIAGAIK